MANLEDSLFIKQSSILEVIKEHKLISSNHLQRKFFGLNPRTLRYHLKKLVDLGLIRKLGSTKGVYYKIYVE
jgi:predicted HTH transcriptional regulator